MKFMVKLKVLKKEAFAVAKASCRRNDQAR
jgi:hypothetical protein